MILLSTDKIQVTQKYGVDLRPFYELPFEEQQHLLWGDFGISVKINDVWYDTLPLIKVARENRLTEDGKYHLIYIQINLETGEYYIGKVNRQKWNEVKRYKGSGLVFTKKYKKHREQFVRYYLLSYKSQKESEIAEAQIVNSELLQDPFCLNLVQGGGGGIASISSEERNKKIREYMLAHPENYQNMLKKSVELFQSGSTPALEARNSKIRDTMNTEEYRAMTSERIKKWKENNPEDYATARENNRKSLQTESYKRKKKEAFDKWRNENPEKYEYNKKKCLDAMHTPEAKQKQSNSLKKWCVEHPDTVKQRAAASAEKTSKAVKMLDLETGEVIRVFKSQQEAAEWLVEQGIAKNTNCKSSISAVCLKRPCTTGYGYRKKAYGYGWAFAGNETDFYS